MRAFLILAVLSGTALAASAGLPTVTTLSAPAAVITPGSATVFVTVNRTTGSGIPTGQVSFLYQGAPFCTANLNGSGVASCTISTAGIAPGTYAISASYAGDSADSPSTSSLVNVLVQYGTKVAFTISPSSVQQLQNGVLVAQVSRLAAAGTPAGEVDFLYGPNVIASGLLDASGTTRVQVNSGSQATGSYGLTAHYMGDALDASSTSATETAIITPGVDVLTYRNNMARTGVQPAETVLTPSNVNATGFGKVYTFTTDGYSYSQPLYVSGYTMSDGMSHNVLFVTTSAGSVYAFDADNNNPSAGYLWHSTVLGSGEQVVLPTDLTCTDTQPSTSIVGTPVIDRTRGVMYLIGKSKLVSGTTTTYFQRLHAFNLADGTEKLGGPTVISGSVAGTGVDSANGMVAFDPFRQNQRAALAEADGSVWIAWASHCDYGNYHGWVMGYNAGNITLQTGIFNTTPNGEQGGIWMAAGGISADNAGNLFTVAGNGTFDGNDGGLDFSETVQRLTDEGNALAMSDWFTPMTEAYLTANDMDMGTGDALLFDDPDSGVAPYLLATIDKTGRTYLLNRYALGNFETGTNSANGDLEDFLYSDHALTNFAFFNNRLYTGPSGEPLAAFDFTPGAATTAGYLAETPSMASTMTFSNGYATGGIQPMISANGSSNAIVWGLDVSGQVLYAFDANNLATQLYASSTDSARDAVAPTVKFTVPVVANGHVYMAGQGAVAVYGLLP